MNDFLKILLSLYGQEEKKGDINNPVIVNMSKELGKGFEFINDDETAWCSVLINWGAMKAGLERSGKANAQSWLEVGEEIKVPETGDIIVLKRGSEEWQGHVGVFLNFAGNQIHVLGGNQSNRVKVSLYDNDDTVLGYRRLKPII